MQELNNTPRAATRLSADADTGQWIRLLIQRAGSRRALRYRRPLCAGGRACRSFCGTRTQHEMDHGFPDALAAACEHTPAAAGR